MMARVLAALPLVALLLDVPARAASSPDDAATPTSSAPRPPMPAAHATGADGAAAKRVPSGGAASSARDASAHPSGLDSITPDHLRGLSLRSIGPANMSG